jgi:high-affinity Fe2+/Pb2+ permease
MLAALIIVFREVFEAGLIIGIVLAVTRAVTAAAGGSRGVLGGVLGACVVALFHRQAFGSLRGAGQELFNAAILGLAVVMLTWHNVWMARHGREMAGEMRAAGEAVAHGSKSLAALRSWSAWRCCARASRSCCSSTASPRQKAARAPACCSAARLDWRRARSSACSPITAS